MKLNVGKCEVLHLGRKILWHQHMLRDNQLESGFVEKDLGVLAVMSQQCVLAAKRKMVNGDLGCIR